MKRKGMFLWKEYIPSFERVKNRYGITAGELINVILMDLDVSKDLVDLISFEFDISKETAIDILKELTKVSVKLKEEEFREMEKIRTKVLL